ncbi:Regulatory protein BlaR1 [Aquisphaera giovannonii]|uniref:Regulatory protein BlaR1 n=1 Tax=Aquisphaera giovannonii TaxID=406548 RepID=A0A5B9WCV8_9BACT|nr:M56 family metallopeptidase [Aquisphaera giovannonii]QEH37771.1 Regulatory protein BlaR1 [Aquisphaera giovannonii]
MDIAAILGRASASPLLMRLGWTLIHSTWQLAAVAAAVAAAFAMLRGRSANARYLAGCAALAIMAAWPAATFARLGAPAAAPRSATGPPAPTTREADREAREREALASGTRRARPVRPTLRGRLEPWVPALVACWGLGVIVLSARLAGGWLVLRGLVRRGVRPVGEGWERTLAKLRDRLGLRRPVRLLESARVQVPMVVGWIRPVVLLPASALSGLPPDQLALILGHELAHIRRHDYLVNLAQSVIETLFFFHPAAWWLSSRIRAERENCCDDLAVACCGDPLDYARALAALEEIRQGTWSLAPSARGGTLLKRIRRVLGVMPAEEPTSRAMAGTLALSTLSLAAAFLLLIPGAPQARAAVEDRRTLTGTVIDAAGKPVPGADVWIVAETYPESRTISLDDARTDSEGRYRLAWDDSRLEGPAIGTRAVWSYHETHGIGRAMLQAGPARSGGDPDRPIRVALSPASQTSLRITDAEGRPLAAAKVTPATLRETPLRLPEPLAERLASRTDGEGSARLLGPSGGSIEAVRVEPPGGGAQVFHRPKGFPDGAELKLAATVAVTGRVTATEPSAVRGLRLWLSASTEPADAGWITTETEVITDDRGAFSGDHLLPGNLSAWPTLPDDAVHRPIDLLVKEVHAEGGVVRIVVPLVRWMRVRGTIREKGTGVPVAGAGVRLHSWMGNAPITPVMARSDERGRFEVLSPPGQKVFCLLEAPEAHIRLTRGVEMPEVVADGQELPPIELERGVALRGVVADEARRPVAGARVVATWDRIGPGVKQPNGATLHLGSRFNASASTSPRGDFVLQGIHAGANVMLEAERDEARTASPQPAAAGRDEPVKLVISDANTVALSGRVVDTTGAPVARAPIRLQVRRMKDDASAEDLRLDGAGEIRTDEAGRFTTARRIKRGFDYRAEVDPGAGHLMSDGSPWLALGPDTAPKLGDVVLRRLRAVEGRILDPGGNPVPGAKVRQAGDGPNSEEVETDQAGRYRLSGIFAEPAFVFAAKEGYRFAGRLIEAGATTADITLERADGPAPVPLRSSPPAMSREQEKKLIHVVFDDDAERALKDPKVRNLDWILRIVARVDPARAREFVDRLPPEDAANRNGYLRGGLAEEIAADSPDEAAEIVAGIRDPNARTYAYELLSRRVPAADRSRRLALLDESLVAGRALAEAENRVLRMADLGRRNLDLGRTDLATSLLREGQQTALRLPTTGYAAFARRRLAEELALIDVPAAFEVLKGTEEDRDYTASLGHIAHRIAAKDPAEAERIVRTMRDSWPNFRDTYIQRVCYRMVAVDRARALNLARTVMTNYRDKARALAAMALGIARAKGDRRLAGKLLDEAFDLLDATSRGNQDQWDGLAMACTAAAGLLPIVEEVDPTRVREAIWRTLAMRPAYRGDDGRAEIPLIAGARVAAMVARYDRDLGRRVLDGLIRTQLDKLTTTGGRDTSFQAESLVTAAAFIAPHQAASLIGRFPDEAGEEGRESLRERMRQAVVTVLAIPPGPERWRRLERRFLQVWPIDEEEDY